VTGARQAGSQHCPDGCRPSPDTIDWIGQGEYITV